MLRRELSVRIDDLKSFSQDPGWDFENYLKNREKYLSLPEDVVKKLPEWQEYQVLVEKVRNEKSIEP